MCVVIVVWLAAGSDLSSGARAGGEGGRSERPAAAEEELPQPTDGGTPSDSRAGVSVSVCVCVCVYVCNCLIPLPPSLLPPSSLSSLQATLVEKESMVLMLQQSFLESDDASPETSAHASPTQNRPLTPSGSTLSLGSTSSMASSLLSDPLSHSPTFKHRDQRYTPYLTNGGGAPLINSSLARRGQMNGSDPNLTEQEGAPPGTKPSTSVPDTLSSQVDPPHKSSLPTSFSHAPSTCDQSDSISSVSAPFPTTVTASSPRHRMRRVTSKTPPPDYHLQAPSLPRSLDREPQRSHTPNLQLFNTLFRDGVLGNHGNGSRGVKMMGRVFVHHHAISNPHRV